MMEAGINEVSVELVRFEATFEGMMNKRMSNFKR